MAELTVTTREGDTRQLSAPEGSVVMRLLRDEGLGVAGTCGGMSSCGSCHVYVVAGPPLPPPGEDEVDMLDALSEVIEVRPSSRLSCQLRLSADTAGLAVEIAPQL